jgi:activating signal cointegrator complex subunit 1
VNDAIRKLLAGDASETLANAGKVKVDSLGTYDVREVQLWVMGSHGPDNEYVICGGISLS